MKTLWTCNKCGDHPYGAERNRIVGMGCTCGGTYVKLDSLVIMDQDDELARLKAMNADLLKISADLDAIVKESKRLKAQNEKMRLALKDLLAAAIHCDPLFPNRWERDYNQARAALNQSSV